MDKRVIKFRKNTVIGAIVFAMIAMALGFFCKYDKPLYSNNSITTYTGLCTDVDFREFMCDGNRYRNLHAVLTIDNGNKYSIAPKFLYTDNSGSRCDQRGAFKEKLLMKTVDITSTNNTNLNGYHTVFQLKIDDEIIVSANAVHNAHLTTRILLWCLYAFAVAVFVGFLFLERPPNLIFRKRKKKR